MIVLGTLGGIFAPRLHWSVTTVALAYLVGIGALGLAAIAYVPPVALVQGMVFVDLMVRAFDFLRQHEYFQDYLWEFRRRGWDLRGLAKWCVKAEKKLGADLWTAEQGAQIAGGPAYFTNAIERPAPRFPWPRQYGDGLATPQRPSNPGRPIELTRKEFGVLEGGAAGSGSASRSCARCSTRMADHRASGPG